MIKEHDRRQWKKYFKVRNFSLKHFGAVVCLCSDTLTQNLDYNVELVLLVVNEWDRVLDRIKWNVDRAELQSVVATLGKKFDWWQISFIAKTSRGKAVQSQKSIITQNKHHTLKVHRYAVVWKKCEDYHGGAIFECILTELQGE